MSCRPTQPWRCPVCRTRRASFTSLLEHQRGAGHQAPCGCPGYHHPHRPGSPCCDQHPEAALRRALRAGETIDWLQVAADRAWDAWPP